MLLGIWVTDDERYQDRYIEFSRETIIFGTGEGSPNIYFIRGVDQERDGSENAYTFECNDSENTEFLFVFHVEEDRNGLIMRLNHPREVVWKKTVEPKEPIQVNP